MKSETVVEISGLSQGGHNKEKHDSALDRGGRCAPG